VALMGDSPFTSTDTHTDVQVRLDVEQDLAISRRRLDHIISRLKENADIMTCSPQSAKSCVGFTPNDIAGLRRIISRLEGATQQLVNAGY
jgi:hypothetical protein